MRLSVIGTSIFLIASTQGLAQPELSPETRDFVGIGYDSQTLSDSVKGTVGLH
jgi:hypothetical protein